MIGIVTAVWVGAACAIGWWALLPTFAVLGVCGGAWYCWKKKYYKDFKQKWYYEYKIDENSMQSLKNAYARRKLRKIIQDENLHPDKYKRVMKYEILDK